MFDLLRFVSFRAWVRRPGQGVRAVLAVMIGVGALVGGQIIDRSVVESLEESLRAATGRTDLRVRAGETGLAEELLDKVRAVPGVGTAVPLLETPAYAVGTAGEVLTVLGVDVTEEGRVRRYAVDGVAEDVVEDPLVFLSQPDSVILTEVFAAEHDLKLEDRLDLQTTTGRHSVVVRGLLAPQGPAVAFGGNLAVMDYQAAQIMFAKERRLDAIDVVVAEGADVAAVAAGLRSALGTGVSVQRPGVAGDVEVASRAVRFLFWLFSCLTLIVGMFLLYNAVSMTVAQRGREIAMLRALGLQRGDTVRLVLCEASVIGIVGSLLGVAFGAMLAPLLLEPLSVTLGIALFARVSGLALSQVGASTFCMAMAVGLATTLLAAWQPARQATRFSPVVAARADAVVALRQGRLPRPFWGMICISAGAALAPAMVWSGMGRLGPLSDVALIVGFALLAPSCVRLAVPLIHRVTAPLGTVGRLAALNLTTNVERSSLTATPLMVAMAFIVTIATSVYSFRGSIVEWIEAVTPRDFQIASVSQEIGRNVLLPPELPDAMASIPGVVGVNRFRMAHVSHQGRRIAVESRDFDPTDPERCCVRFRRGDPEQAFAQLASGEAVVVSDNFSDHFGVYPGDSVTLNTARGPRTLPIAATATNYNSGEGTIIMARHLFIGLFDDDRVDQILVGVQPGVDKETVRREIAARYGEKYQLVIFSLSDLREDIAGRIDAAFMPASALFILAVVIGCLGIANSLHVTVAERTREIGVLRSLGFRRRDVVRLVVTEALLLGSLGAVLGVALGILLSYLWVSVHFRYLLGWVIDYHFGLVGTLIGLVATLVTAPLAGWGPARSAARVAPVVALAHE